MSKQGLEQQPVLCGVRSAAFISLTFSFWGLRKKEVRAVKYCSSSESESSSLQ